ncbi:S41 family peptidase [Spirosoma soli]|uniref:S41 family peptidase n=1 Tax=Spirosoma soli TaxID=1770529 RepID=A0ABW5M749_9BACT
MRTFCVWRPALVLAVSGAFLMASCKKDPEVNPSDGSTVSNQEVNNWILSTMRDWYYWNDKIPANPDESLAPKDFFDSILYKFSEHPDGDRFSWIEESAEQLQAELSGESKTAGFDFNLYRTQQNSDNIVGSVLYVLPNSPAAQAGLKRGDIFYSIDGQRLTVGNYEQLLGASGDTHSYGFANFDASGKLVETNTTKQITSVVFQEDPVYKDSVYTIGGKTIGYLVYNQFVPGPNGSATRTYDQKVDAIFSKFKASGVNELVLDLRYNPGGDVQSAVNLASSISPVATNSTVFAKFEYNKSIMDYLRSEGVANQLNYNFRAKASNIGANLSRVFVLTTGRTASASELIINGLKPFMNVVTIGDTTVGKNVGSQTFTDTTGRIKWGMQPIVIKIFNSKGQSDYTGGFAPNTFKQEPLNLRQLGDISESYLGEAIAQITGTPNARRPADIQRVLPFVGSSLSRKAGGSNMFIDAPMPKIKRLQ